MKNLSLQIKNNWRKIVTILIPILMVYFLYVIIHSYSYNSLVVKNGTADLSGIDFNQNKNLVYLAGDWEFYWNKLLVPEVFDSAQAPKPDSYIKVPGVWSKNRQYPKQGYATYKVTLIYPAVLKDPALRVQYIANAYKLYVNGKLSAEVGSGLDNKEKYVKDDAIKIIDLPTDTNKVDLILQVSNLTCAQGGLLVAPMFGSKAFIYYQAGILFFLQIAFMGIAIGFSFHHFVSFLLRRQNKATLLFSIFCFTVALRSVVWGIAPLKILFENIPVEVSMIINYCTGYNFVVLVILFVYFMFPDHVNKKIMAVFIFPSLLYDLLLVYCLLFGSLNTMTYLTAYIYLILLIQMIYLIFMIGKIFLKKAEYSFLMFLAICVLVWSMLEDLINFVFIENMNLSCMFLFGNIAVIGALSYIQSRQNADNYKKLVLYNEKLLENERLNEKILSTEMSFLKAQIKPHFLYNALNAIANVCEKNEAHAGNLIIDLAQYLRESLEFNNLNTMTTLKKELEFVDTYFRIEQSRFGNKIQLEKEIDVPLDLPIPVLVLQPLVENAVQHGVSKNPKGGTVTIKISQQSSNVCIEVQNEGAAIKEEKLAAIFDDTVKEKGIGLLNINSRLKKLYGHGLEINSLDNLTCVKFLLPKENCNEGSRS